MLWDFYQYEKYHGRKVTGIYFHEVQVNSYFLFKNKPEKQRRIRCIDCGISLDRETPRIYWHMPFYGGHLCPSCARKRISHKIRYFEEVKSFISEELEKGKSVLEAIDAVLTDERYKKKYALAKMIQVVKE